MSQAAGTGHQAPRKEDATCWAHVVRRVRELVHAELPADYVAAASSPEKWTIEVVQAHGMLPRAGDVVEMVGRAQGECDGRHVGVMIDPFTLEHFDRRQNVVTRVALAVVRKSGCVVRMVRPFRRAF